MDCRIKHRRKRKRGLSLVELVLLFVLLAILMGITAVSLKSSIKQEGPRGMAHTLVSDLRAARAEATRSGKMVAFCFPSEGKTNSFSRTALLRKGSQRGHVYKILSYDEAYNGFIFIGRWPRAEVFPIRVPVGWETSTADELCLYFRPDGTAFSNDIPAVDGEFPILIGSAFNSSGGGADATVSGVVEPHTVWVSNSGNVRMDERAIPSGTTLPTVGQEPTVAELDLSGEPPARAPKIENIDFLPKGVPGLETVGLGQNYVNIHPDQKESERLEYGIATMLITASDADGGPLYFDLKAIASSGDEGNFTVSNETGSMDYIYDPKTDRGQWQAMVSWRPPPGADEDTVYELQVTVRDEEGNSDFTASGAGLIPRIANLPPHRMVMQTTDRELYLSNIEGTSVIKITEDGEPEYEPFFSQDGTRIYSKRDTPGGGLELRVRNSDGTGTKVLRTFPPDVVRDDPSLNIKFDPTYEYAAYRFNIRPIPYRPQRPQRVTIGRREVWRLLPGDGTIRHTDENGNNRAHNSIYELEVIHLNSGSAPVRLASDAFGAFHWDRKHKHTLRFQSVRPYRAPDDLRTPSAEQFNDGIRAYIPEPGHATVNDGRGVALSGFPPSAGTPVSSEVLPATGLFFNPPEPIWYLDPLNNNLGLKNVSDGNESTLTSNRVNIKPAWSADGRFAAYVEQGGNLVVKEVLNPDFTPKPSPVTTYSSSGSNIQSVGLSPQGRWVFFVRNGDLYRAINSNGASSVKLSETLGKKIASFAVSQ